mgnify:FL=1
MTPQQIQDSLVQEQADRHASKNAIIDRLQAENAALKEQLSERNRVIDALKNSWATETDALKAQVAQLQELNENHAFNAKYFKAENDRLQSKSAALVDALERARNRIQGLSEAITGQPDACKYIDEALAAFKEKA